MDVGEFRTTWLIDLLKFICCLFTDERYNSVDVSMESYEFCGIFFLLDTNDLLCGWNSFGGKRVAYCDAGVTPPLLTEDYLTSLRTASETVFRHDTLNYATKEYSIELKPLFSAFQPRSFALTSLRSFLLFYLPLLAPKEEDDDNDFLPDSSDEHHLDLVVPFKKSVKQILREVSMKLLSNLSMVLAVGWYIIYYRLVLLLLDAFWNDLLFTISHSVLRGNFLKVHYFSLLPDRSVIQSCLLIDFYIWSC